MILYKITWDNGTEERSVCWRGTQADAKAAVKEHVDDEPESVQVDVPTDKPGLLKWLNENSRNPGDGGG